MIRKPYSFIYSDLKIDNMKGISAVIGALIVLIITIVLGGLAYTYIVGTTQQRISNVLSVDPATSVCVDAPGTGTDRLIEVGIKNDGTAAVQWSTIKISGKSPGGATLTVDQGSGATDNCENAGQLGASSIGVCDTDGPTAGNQGFTDAQPGVNTVIITAGASSAQGFVSCP